MKLSNAMATDPICGMGVYTPDTLLQAHKEGHVGTRGMQPALPQRTVPHPAGGVWSVHS